MSEEIALFPLNTVLFPGGPLVLRIFEARYLDLVKRCMRDGTGFGVVQIREGQEAGGPALTFDVGTYARIVDFSQQPDGLLGIRALGERRFRIVERRRARDGLNLADVEWLPVDPPTPLPEAYAELVAEGHEQFLRHPRGAEQPAALGAIFDLDSRLPGHMTPSL